MGKNRASQHALLTSEKGTGKCNTPRGRDEQKLRTGKES